MKIIAVANQKGGVGKTTTAHALAVGLSLHQKNGRPPLLIDMDPQGSLTRACGLDRASLAATTLDFMDCASFPEIAIPMPPYFDLIPTNQALETAPDRFKSRIGRDLLLKRALEKVSRSFDYDYVVIDCPPSSGLLSFNALTAATHMLVVMQCHFFSMDGLATLLQTFNDIQGETNPNLDFLGILLTFYSRQTSLSRDVHNYFRRYYPSKIFETKIRHNVRLPEAQSRGINIYQYDPDSIGAHDYTVFVREFIKRIEHET